MIFMFVGHAFLYNLVIKAKMLHNFLWSICSYIPDRHSYRIICIKCRINTVVSPDDGHIVNRKF